jgi:putative membrane protein
MFRINMLLCSLLLAFMPRSDSAEGQKPAVPFNDTAFVTDAASGGMHEVELGKIAANKAKDPAVKKFAQRMVNDHSKANEALKAAAKAANIPVPDRMSPKDQQEIERFKNYMGESFDSDYAKHMVMDHEKDVAEFTRASKEAKTPQIRDFAAATLPVLQEHLKMAKELPGQQK